MLKRFFGSHKSAQVLKKFVPEEQKRHFVEEGWVVLPGAVRAEQINALEKDIAEFRRQHDDGKDEFGHGKRIGLLHVALKNSLATAMNEDSMNFLRWYFGDEPTLFGTLTFDVGTEQNAHHDAAFFQTSPADAMAGVWIALEDIHEDSGPLFYVPKSHRHDRLTAAQVLERNPDLQNRVLNFRQNGMPAVEARDLADEVYAAWDIEMQRRLEEMGAKKMPALIRKGDVFIWHGWLVHGGLPRVTPDRTRRSMVCHFIARNSKMWDQYNFFLNGEKLTDIAPLPFQYESCEFGSYVKHEKPVVFSQGNAFFKA